jgi:LAS superfamily LD-carboxypeptidase LdcB
MMKYPAKDVTIPKRLGNFGNGRLPDNMLKPVKCGGRMFIRAAEDFNELYEAALAAGIKLRNVGDYRSYEAQKQLFEQRYSKKDEGRKPQVTRTVEGVTYFLRKGASPSSTPGKSNHGFGLAIDLGVEVKGVLKALASEAKALKWMCENAPSFNFFLQSSDPKSPEFEAWHWQWCKPSE